MCVHSYFNAHALNECQWWTFGTFGRRVSHLFEHLPSVHVVPDIHVHLSVDVSLQSCPPGWFVLTVLHVPSEHVVPATHGSELEQSPPAATVIVHVPLEHAVPVGHDSELEQLQFFSQLVQVGMETVLSIGVVCSQ